MSGVIPLRSPYASTAWIGTNLPFTLTVLQMECAEYTKYFHGHPPLMCVAFSMNKLRMRHARFMKAMKKPRVGRKTDDKNTNLIWRTNRLTNKQTIQFCRRCSELQQRTAGNGQHERHAKPAPETSAASPEQQKYLQHFLLFCVISSTFRGQNNKSDSRARNTSTHPSSSHSVSLPQFKVPQYTAFYVRLSIVSHSCSHCRGPTASVFCTDHKYFA